MRLPYFLLALVALALFLPGAVPAADADPEETPAAYTEWEDSVDEDWEDSAAVQPSIHPGPETDRQSESGLTASGPVAGFLRAFIEVLSAIGKVTRIAL